MDRREWLRGLFFAFIGLLLLGCGHHYELDVSSLTAARESDDRVTATVTVTCNEVGVDCPRDYCLKVQWFDVAAPGTKLDEVSSCDIEPISGPRDLADEQSAVFVMTSDNVLLPRPLRIVASVTKGSSGGNGYVRETEITFP